MMMKPADLEIYYHDGISVLEQADSPNLPTLPPAGRLEIHLRYGGWSLRELQNFPIVVEKDLIKNGDQLPDIRAKPGVYKLHLTDPASHLLPLHLYEFQRAPVVVVATAAIVHYLRYQVDLLYETTTFCQETSGEEVYTVIGGTRYDSERGKILVSRDSKKYIDRGVYSSRLIEAP